MKKVTMLSGAMLMVLLLASCGVEKTTEVVKVSSNGTQTSIAVTDESIEQVSDEAMIFAQGFAEYDESFIGESENTVLFFHQESCSTCKATEADLIENGVPSDLQVLKIDIDADSSVELKQKYGVTMKHTFVQVDENGEMIKKWNGSLTGDDIAEQLGQGVMMDKSEDIMEKDDAMMEGDKMEGDVMMDKSDESVEVEEAMTKELAGVYAEYDENLVDASGDTVLAFFAGWCPSCVAADKSMSASEIPEGLSILKVDFDSAIDLRQKYGVTSQHTFVQIDSDGNLIKKWAGGTTVDDVVERVQ